MLHAGPQPPEPRYPVCWFVTETGQSSRVARRRRVWSRSRSRSARNIGVCVGASGALGRCVPAGRGTELSSAMVHPDHRRVPWSSWAGAGGAGRLAATIICRSGVPEFAGDDAVNVRDSTSSTSRLPAETNRGAVWDDGVGAHAYKSMVAFQRRLRW